jgi:neurotransmitter:Na+ symporter, NSS family
LILYADFKYVAPWRFQIYHAKAYLALSLKAMIMDRWSSKRGFILAAVGSAVGIGNVWRFPAQVGSNGGGAYYLPYLVAIFCFAIPLMVLEFSVGKKFKGSVISAFAQVKGLRPLGGLVCLVSFAVLSYYLVITGWVLAYLFAYAADIRPSFSDFTSSYWPLLFFLMSALATGLVVSFGVKNGLERTNTVLMPLVFVILLVMVFFSTSLSGFSDGVRFFLTPDFSVLLKLDIWAAAFGQAFFSLGIGEGILMTYGGYLGEDTDLFKSSLIVASLDLVASTLSGLVIFPVVFTFGLLPSAGAELAFTTLPRAFDALPAGRAFAMAFFMLLFFVALTSAIAFLEVNIAVLVDSLGMSRRRATALLTLLVFLLGLPSALSYSAAGFNVLGMRFLDLIDDLAGTLGLLLTALIISLSFSWLLKDPPEEIAKNRLIRSMLRYIVPSMLLALLSFNLVSLIQR